MGIDLRCRYCNKAISLLRRLNDAEFCSDAHRFSYAEEQQLAMQRLTDNQPAHQRMQRTSDAKQGRSAPMGSHVPFRLPAAALIRLPVDVPTFLRTPSPIILGERDHRFRAGMPKSSDSARLSPPVGASYPARVQMIGQIPQLRVVIPRSLASMPQWEQVWHLTIHQAMAAVPFGKALNPQSTVRTTPSLAPIATIQWCLVPWHRRKRQPVPAIQLEPIAHSPLDQPVTRVESVTGWLNEIRLQCPQSQLTFLSPPLPEVLAEPDVWMDHVWETFANSPLGALLAATSYPTVSPSVPILQPCGGSAREIGFRSLWATGRGGAAAEPSGVTVSASAECPVLIDDVDSLVVSLNVPATLRALDLAGAGRLATAGTLCPVQAPEAAAAPYQQQREANALAPYPVPSAAAFVAPIPVSTNGHLPFVSKLQPVTPPAPARIPRIAATDAVEFGSRFVLPVFAASWTVAGAALALYPRVRAIRPPQSAAGRHPSIWQATWVSDQLPPVIPTDSSKSERHLREWGRALAILPPAPMGTVAAHGTGTTWMEPDLSLSVPECRSTPAGEGLPLAGRAPHIPQPNPTDCRPPSQFVQTLKDVLRVRLPLHNPLLVSRYGMAESVPVIPPAPTGVNWRPEHHGAVDLCPDQILPALSKNGRTLALRIIPARLYKVPNARPAARRSDGRALNYPMGEWASPPAICSLELPFDDGSPRKRPTAAHNFPWQVRELFSTAGLRSAWARINHLPSDLKWIAMVVPLIIGIWILAQPSATNNVAEAAPSATEDRQPETIVPQAEEANTAATAAVLPPEKASSDALEPLATLPPEPSGRWGILTARIANRASVDLVEDFHNGLSLWSGRGEWARTWSYDRSGTVRPGQFAIFQPTLSMRDYVLEIKASIDRRSIQWLVRASGPRNYHFARLNVTPGAPLTKLELERWSVINGRMGRVTRLPLPHGGANQTLYSIRVEVNGDSVTTYLQDQVIDTFSDARLPEGGVGLMGAGDDRPRIYGIHVFHQNDFLGKLCSFLVPQPIHSQGSD